ncbi:hypothetical protein JJL45_07255 [Tamlana sp. s12]|uniref:capsular polysaccharide export protein, LipB/KpsS family n=1 Tax=Tamlana sp. s12 TaxID=1630406 RepID=UPI0007FFBB49|nr:hypothetical protein [Tamlana sp. s12]OBQ55553.1 hypothetical protein VQ01_08895 [Tamlana sp. s12]QQY83775.1 hypothetical protein JJL45_07255 [Tamlana sp. s12]
MNVTCIGYFDKHSRFYLDIRKELRKTRNNLSFKILSICFSGFLYNFIRYRSCQWPPLKVWIQASKNKKKYKEIINKTDVYDGINYKKLISYHINLNQNISETQLLLQCLAYIDFFKAYFRKHQTDTLILLGDSRLIIETCVAVAKKLEIKIFYVEQGPFNTTFFNDVGANANAVISETHTKASFSEIKQEVDKLISSVAPKKQKRSFIYRGFDFIFSILFEKTKLYPPDLKHTDTFPILFKRKKEEHVIINPNNNIILLILQVPMDVNMIYHSPYFNNHFSILKSVHENLPQKTQLVIREHPVYRGKYEKALYQYASKHDIKFDNASSLKEALAYSNLVVVNNSTVGIEAISLKKSVVVLGKSYYNSTKICISYTPSENLSWILEKGLEFKLDDKNRYFFLYNLKHNNLIQGTINAKHLKASKIIAKKVLQRNKIN